MKILGFALIAGALILASPVRADDWPCEVLLCLANPQGPTAAPACVPPIMKLWRRLALGHGIPFCASAHSNSPSANYTPLPANTCPSDQQYYGGATGTELLCRVSGYITITNQQTGVSQLWVNSSTTATAGSELDDSLDTTGQQR
jgi:hypothetical protein